MRARLRPWTPRRILEKISRVHGRALHAAEVAEPERAAALRVFAANLEKSFYGFEPDFFQQNLLRIVDDVISVIKGSIELWPTLVEVCYFQKDRKGLPKTKVRNQKKMTSSRGPSVLGSKSPICASHK